MSSQASFDFDATAQEADLLKRIMDRSDRVFIKKLSNNDRGWAATPRTTNQAGVYIPAEHREGGFFPPLESIDRGEPDMPDIRVAEFETVWPQQDGERKASRLRHFTSKGPEAHMTTLPKELFGELLPASFLVMGRQVQDGNFMYECLTIDSGSEEATLLQEFFDLDPDFLVGEFDPVELRTRERERVLDFAEQVIAAWLAGTINVFARDNAAMPVTVELARLAREAFLTKTGLAALDPFAMSAPGDALREISRSIEWDLFREFQRRERSVELVRLVLGDEPRMISAKDVIRSLVDELPAIDALMLSASQQRKSRAGYSYEHHIEAMLAGGNIPYEKQVVIEARKRPDFILPSLAFIDSGRPEASSGLILSAKTTLRERWKQVEREMGSRRLFLTTVDENIAGNAIEDMASMGVQLVVPESLVTKERNKTKMTEYHRFDNVLTFGQFCQEVLRPSLEIWR